MYTKIINFIESFLSEYEEFQGTSFREGTAIRDLFIKAFAMLYRRILSLLETVILDLDIRNYATATEGSLNKLGRMWFLERSNGTYASGRIKIYLDSPIAVTIARGTVFRTADGSIFNADSDYTYSAAQVFNNKVGNEYYIIIGAKAKNKGSDGNIIAHAITEMTPTSLIPWTRVDNPNPFTGGANHESNTEFYNRISNSVNTRELLITKGSLASALYDAFPTFIDIDVVSAGEDAMERDVVMGIVLGGEGEIPYSKSDFYGKTAGQLESNKSIAYEYSIDSITPEDDDTGTEVSNADYNNLAAYDVSYYSHRGSRIVEETFGTNTTFTDNTDWIPFDNGYEFGQTHYSRSIYAYNGYLLIGETTATQSATI